MSQMYLVRRENRLFLGPMTVEEFRDGLRKMNFGLQDEIAGNCGKWVILDNEEMIRKNYPELVSIISSELPVAWREMTGHAKQISKKEQKVKPQSSSSSSSRDRPVRRPSGDIESYGRKRRQRSNALLVGCFLIAICAVGAGLYIKTHDEPLPPVSDVATLAQKQDPNEFLNEMGNRIIPIVTKINRGKDPQIGAWMPYVRMYAFYTNGAVDNLSQKSLRGAVPPSAPQDCSVDSWKKRWRESAVQNAAWINGKSLVRTPITRALSWDPAWIRRRPAKGWYKPRNWFEGCLMSATVAMRAVANEGGVAADVGGVNSEMLASISKRLQAELEILQTGRTSIVGDPSTVLGALTCMDQSETVAALQRCRGKYPDQGLQQAMDDHANWQWVRLALATGSSGVVDPALQQEVSQGLSKLTGEDLMSKLDFSAELKFLQLLQQSTGKLDGVVERVGSEFADVRLRP